MINQEEEQFDSDSGDTSSNILQNKGMWFIYDQEIQENSSQWIQQINKKQAWPVSVIYVMTKNPYNWRRINMNYDLLLKNLILPRYLYLEQLNLDLSKCTSVQFLQHLNAPNLNILSLQSQNPIQLKSIRKCYLPNLNVLRILVNYVRSWQWLSELQMKLPLHHVTIGNIHILPSSMYSSINSTTKIKAKQVCILNDQSYLFERLKIIRKTNQ